MNDLKFFELFGDIDEKLVQQANDDLNFWQKAREGVVVRTGNSRRSPLRIVFASVACAAVVFGAVILLRNYLKNGSTYIPGYPDSSSVQGGESSNIESEFTINDEVMWAIGKTVDEVTEKYGSATVGRNNVYTFENGYGIYVFGDSCKTIGEISAKDFLIGDLSNVTLDNFASKFGFEVVPLNDNDDPNTMYEGYRQAYYTHPSYKNITFSMLYKESGFDGTAKFDIRYNG